MQLGDVTLAQKAAGFAHAKHEKRGSGQTRKQKADQTENRIPGEKILDQPREPKSKGKRNETGGRRPKQPGPGKERAQFKASFFRCFDRQRTRITCGNESQSLGLVMVDLAFNDRWPKRRVNASVGGPADTEGARTRF